mmetsp:Transcript_45189/g.88419  ORF Transcript_45189/g.88419 Transcript_45189/m.88419 type:complete len:326 (+) Transcript_45189:38-1015(+)
MKQLRIVIRCFLVSKLSFDADARRRREFITPPPASPNPPNPAFINNASSRFKGENFIRTAKLIACTVAVAWTTALPLPPIPCIEIGGSAHAASVLLKGPGPGGFQSLSRAGIQKKLNTVPVFYIPTQEGIQSNIYLSYDDATAAAKSSGRGADDVKATTLDQIYYPIILRRGRMRMAPPPPEIAAVEASLADDTSEKKEFYKLIPSSTAISAVTSSDMVNNIFTGADKSAIPVFSAERLAFAGPEGPQLPLFLEKEDCLQSYQRLRSRGSSNRRYPEIPVLRITTLLDEVKSMERGDRPVLANYEFYSKTYDLIHAQDLMSSAFK